MDIYPFTENNEYESFNALMSIINLSIKASISILSIDYFSCLNSFKRCFLCIYVLDCYCSIAEWADYR